MYGLEILKDANIHRIFLKYGIETYSFQIQQNFKTKYL